MQHLCPRCRQAITTAEDGTLSFCVYCGAPQIRLSSELAEAAVAADAAREQGSTSTIVPELSPTSRKSGIVWRGAIQCAALAGMIALLLGLLGAWKDVLGGLQIFWAMSAPVVTLGIYSARFPKNRIVTRFGARLGLLTGAAVALASLAVTFGDGLLSRFVFHTSNAFDANTATAFAQAQQRGVTWAGAQPPDVAAQMQHMLALPEFRASMMLMMIVLPVVLYLLYSMAGGAFAGMLRSRRPAQS